jgi:hypothetical protein
MKKLSSTICALAVVATASSARADGGPFGLGLELGQPTGLSLKYYLGKSHGGTLLAIQGGIGASRGPGDDGLHLHAEVLWHPVVVTRTPDFTMPFYLGVGGRILDDDDDYCFGPNNDRRCVDDDDTHFGVRVPFGLLMDFTKAPFDVFIELSVNLDFIQISEDDYDDDDDVLDLDFVIGGRYYF